MFKLGWRHRTKFKDIDTQGGGTPHITNEVFRCSNLCGDTAQNSKLGWDTAQNLGKGELIQEPGRWVVGGSNVILDPTLALIRAQLGFRIQVRAECGKKISATQH